MPTKNKFEPGDNVLWADPSKHSSNRYRAKVVRQVGKGRFGPVYELSLEGGGNPQAFESELEGVGGHVHYNMATVIPTSILTLEKDIKAAIQRGCVECSDVDAEWMEKLFDSVNTMYAELHEALDLKPIMPGFPEFIMGSMARDLGHNLPGVVPACKGHPAQLPPVPTRVQKYLEYWERNKGPRISYTCRYCDTKLKTYRPVKGDKCDSFVECPYCEEGYFIDVSHRKVEVHIDPATYPNDVAQAIMHLVRKSPGGEGVFQLVHGDREILLFNKMGRWTVFPDCEVFRGLVKNLCASAVQPGQSFLFEEKRYGDSR